MENRPSNLQYIALGMVVTFIGLGAQSLNPIEPRHLCNPSEWYNFMVAIPLLILIFAFVFPWLIKKVIEKRRNSKLKRGKRK